MPFLIHQQEQVYSTRVYLYYHISKKPVMFSGSLQWRAPLDDYV